MKIYLLKQTQTSEDFNEKTIGVFTSKKVADEVCEDLNAEYFIEDEHFYEVEEMNLNDSYWTSGEYLDLLFKIPKTKMKNNLIQEAITNEDL